MDYKAIEHEQLLAAGEKLPIIIFINIFIGAITIMMMWSDVPYRYLLSWIALLISSLLLRLALYLTYKRSTVETTPVWNRYFIITSFFSGIVWGMVGLLIEFYVAEAHQGFEVFILGAMAVGSIVTATYIRWNYLAFMIPMLLFPSIYYFLQIDVYHHFMGVMILFFMVVLSISSINFRNIQAERVISFKKLSNSEQRLKEITSSMGEGILVIDKNGILEFMNAEAEHILGWNFDEIKNTDLHDLIHLHAHGADNSCIVKKAYLHGEKNHSEDDHFKRKNGEIFPISLTAAPINDDHKTSGAVIIFRDITERKEIEKQLSDLALTDRLTGLYNRGSFDETLSYELERAQRYNRSLSLLMLDLDYFKKINDTYGHQAGDDVLKKIANVIKQSIRGSDYPARFGGEEFIIILPETENSKAVELAQRIRKTLENEPIAISENETIHVTTSIGVVTSRQGITTQTLLYLVDKALYKAKRNGRNQVSL
ncbi:diguanylate cyclase [Sulfurimonas sp. HSL3-2]|uniref:sensor domain-containing diguanylate cyclase n=1 Tax=Hydrocurvibacter mobilis TaxID=3131936 RepID=UPI0031F85CA6